MDKRLFRNEHDKVIAGVSSGVAEYMEVDVTIIRLLFVLSTIFLVGTGILVYLVMWIVVPVNNDPAKRFSKFNEFYGGKSSFSSPPAMDQEKYTAPANEEPFKAYGFKTEKPLDFKPYKNNETGRTVGGLFLLVVGIYFLLNEFEFIPFWFSISKLWPLVFVAIGVSFIMKSKRKNAWEDWKSQQEQQMNANTGSTPPSEQDVAGEQPSGDKFTKKEL